MRIAIFDYGAGNLFSLKSALKRNGASDVTIINDMADLEKKYDGLVLPGVGNFDPAMTSVVKNTDELGRAIRKGDRKSTRLNSSHELKSRMPSSA